MSRESSSSYVGEAICFGRRRDTFDYSTLLAEMAMRSEDKEASDIGKLTISDETAPRGVIYTPNPASRHDSTLFVLVHAIVHL